MIGEVIVSSLNIRRVPTDQYNTPIGKLYLGDKVEASEKVSGWWHLTKVTRKADGKVETPPADVSWYAYEGATNGYIRDITQPTPSPTPAPALRPLTITIEGDGYETVTVTINPTP